MRKTMFENQVKIGTSESHSKYLEYAPLLKCVYFLLTTISWRRKKCFLYLPMHLYCAFLRQYRIKIGGEARYLLKQIWQFFSWIQFISFYAAQKQLSRHFWDEFNAFCPLNWLLQEQEPNTNNFGMLFLVRIIFYFW